MDTTVYRSPLPSHLVAARRGPWRWCWHKRKKNEKKRTGCRGKEKTGAWEGDDDRVTGARDVLHLKPKYVFSSYLLYYTMICSSPLNNSRNHYALATILTFIYYSNFEKDDEKWWRQWPPHSVYLLGLLLDRMEALFFLHCYLVAPSNYQWTNICK
jgi:hypothetical protein